MAVVDFAVHLSSRFQCAEPQDASPYRKKQHVVGEAGQRAGHCMLELAVGTFGSTCKRTDVNFYQGHVPDAPVLLGPEQAAIYKAGIAQAGWGPKRLFAVTTAAGFGVLMGLAVGGIGLCGVAIGHLVAPSVVAAVSWGPAGASLCGGAVAGAVVCGAFEISDWAYMQRTLAALLKLCERAEKRVGAMDTAVDAFMQSDNWVLQQAALELAGDAPSA